MHIAQMHLARASVSTSAHAATGEHRSSEPGTGVADSAHPSTPTPTASGTAPHTEDASAAGYDAVATMCCVGFVRHQDHRRQHRSAPSSRKLHLHTGASMKPHPDKVAKGGEDAYYVAENKMSLGVADGVGGWADIGVDAGEYSRMLMDKARAAARGTPPGSTAPQTILESAYKQTDARGSCTACILVRRLQIVVRRHRTTMMTHRCWMGTSCTQQTWAIVALWWFVAATSFSSRRSSSTASTIPISWAMLGLGQSVTHHPLHRHLASRCEQSEVFGLVYVAVIMMSK